MFNWKCICKSTFQPSVSQTFLYYYHLYKVEDKQPPRQLSSPDKAEELTACLTESEATIQNLNAKLMQCEKSHSKLESPLVLSIKSHLTTLTV